MNYHTATPAKIFDPLEQNLMNELYPSSQNDAKEDQLGIQKQMNPMTTMKADFFKEEQHQYGLNDARVPGLEQQDDELMLGNMPVFNQHYCDQMTDKLRHLNMSKNGQRKNNFRINASRLERHPFNVIHPLKVINCSKDSASSLALSKQGSGASTGSAGMANPLGLPLEDAKRNAGFDPVDQILNIDDLLLKNEDEQDKCDSSRNLQSVVDTEAQDEASRTGSFTLSPIKRQFQSIAQSSSADSKFACGSLPELQPQHSLATEATSNSACSTELEYKDTAKNCKSFLINNNLPVLPEQDEEQLDLQCHQNSCDKTHIKARESKLREKIEQIRSRIREVQTSHCGRRLLKLNQLRIQLQKEQKELKLVGKLRRST